MAETYHPPANLDDFDRSSNPKKLRDGWHLAMDRLAGKGSAGFPAAFSAVAPPGDGGPPKLANPEWTGLPRTIKRVAGPSIAAAARLVDEPRAIGAMDPVDMARYEPIRDIQGNPVQGFSYRSQDEYLEWAVRRDADNVVTEVLFTCEGPEYWDHIATDQKLLVDLYQEICEDPSVKLEHLLFDQDLTWRNPYSRGSVERFNKGDYNRYNRWNMHSAVHLTQPANTLGAEVTLALEATRPYGKPTPVTTDPDLVCCAGYGGINRMSDPTIGSGVNTQAVQLGKRVALRNPIGLYIKGIQPNVFNFSDGTPFDAQEQCWEVVRPKPAAVTDMIVRARFRVPKGIQHKGKQLRVGDLFLRGEQITTGGQIADVVTMTLYALAIRGAPKQERVPCFGRPCQDKSHPDFIHAIPFDSKCPQGGISPQSGAALASTHAEFALTGIAAGKTPDPLHRYTRAQIFRP
jgi:hypothetical protein